MQYMMFADEANPEQQDLAKFFIYGGCFFPVESISGIHEQLEELRRRFGLKTNDQLKFNSRSRPEGCTGEQHTEMKADVYRIANDAGVKFCGYAILHAIARNKDHEELVGYGGNILLAKYNEFLGENGARGWATFDRLNVAKPYAYLQEKFANRVAETGSDIRLENITGYSFTCDNASHISSMADIIIGGFRYVINEPERDKVGKELVKSLTPLFWGREVAGVKMVGNRGLVLRPRDVKAAKYLADYDEIRTRLTAWSKTVSDEEAA